MNKRRANKYDVKTEIVLRIAEVVLFSSDHWLTHTTCSDHSSPSTRHWTTARRFVLRIRLLVHWNVNRAYDLRCQYHSSNDFLSFTLKIRETTKVTLVKLKKYFPCSSSLRTFVSFLVYSNYYAFKIL